LYTHPQLCLCRQMKHGGWNKDENQNKTSRVVEKISGFHGGSLLTWMLFLSDWNYVDVGHIAGSLYCLHLHGKVTTQYTVACAAFHLSFTVLVVISPWRLEAVKILKALAIQPTSIWCHLERESILANALFTLMENHHNRFHSV